jgi:fucokinase
LEPEGNEFEIKTDSLGNIEFFLSSVKHRVPADIAAGCFDKSGVDGNIYTLLLESTQSLALEERMRIYSYASLAATGIIREQLKENSLFCVREMIKYGTVGDDFYNFTPVIKRKTYQINLPLRVNWCGTWTDAPPYCLENGGAVVNAAVKINDLLPVKVLIEKLDEPKVVLECFDYGCRKEFYDTDELSDFASKVRACSLRRCSDVRNKNRR